MARLSGEGLSVEVPAGWDARIFRRPTAGAETTHAVLQAGNFALPPTAGDYGDGAVQLMRRTNVLVILVEFHPSSTANALFAATGMPPPFRPADASTTALQHGRFGQAGMQRFFSVAGRAWCLYVVLGSFQVRQRLIAAANAFVSNISVRPL